MRKTIYLGGKTVHSTGIQTSITCVVSSPVMYTTKRNQDTWSDKWLVIRTFIPYLLTYLSTPKITHLPLLNTFFTPFPQPLLIATTKGNI